MAEQPSGLLSEVEFVMRKHLPLSVDGMTLCLCDVSLSYVGPIGHRLHVAAALEGAGLLASPASDGSRAHV